MCLGRGLPKVLRLWLLLLLSPAHLVNGRYLGGRDLIEENCRTP